MIYDRFMPARVPSSIGVESIEHLQHTSGYAGITGTVCIFTSGEIAEAGANPTLGTIVGVALAPANSNPGYNAANTPTVSTGRFRGISVARANRQTYFCGYLTNGSSTRIAPVQADIGNAATGYGITAYSQIWTVDKNKVTTDGRVLIYDIDLNWNGVIFKFLEAAILA